ncbi:O-antigen ligase family protein [Snuella lapsa]|uniref:O-antigen ligase family protein n=2 Tax=Snuella lapsa TaxID=870481 RepID=A0ABP6XQP0_9FLAO
MGYYSSNHSGFKLTGSFFNPGPYAGFLASVCPVAFGIYLFKEKVIQFVQVKTRISSKWINMIIPYVFEYVPLLGIISIALVLPASHSRGAWLAVIISSGFLIECRYHFFKKYLKEFNNLKRVVFIGSVLCIVGASFLGVYYFKKGSADGRLFIWKVTSGIIKDNPVFGIGFDRFKAHYMDSQAGYFTNHGETSEALVADNSYYAFNDWLQFVAENGMIGFLFLLLILYGFFKIKIAPQDKFLSLIVQCTCLSIGVFALVSYPVQILPIKLVLVVMLAFLGNLDSNGFTFSLSPQKVPHLMWGYKMMFLALGIIVVVAYPKLRGVEQSFRVWKIALTTYQYGDYENAIETYEEAYPLLKKDGDFLMNYGKALTMAKRNDKAVVILLQTQQYLNTTIVATALGDAYKGLKEYDKAETAYQQAYNMIPIRFYPLYLLAKLYDESGQKEKAISIAQKVLEKEVKVPSTAIKEIQAEMQKLLKNNNDSNVRLSLSRSVQKRNN